MQIWTVSYFSLITERLMLMLMHQAAVIAVNMQNTNKIL